MGVFYIKNVSLNERDSLGLSAGNLTECNDINWPFFPVKKNGREISDDSALYVHGSESLFSFY